MYESVLPKESRTSIAGRTELRTLPNIEKRVYIPTKEIWATDGWLSPKGIFWACGDDHDACAKHVLSRYKRLHTGYIEQNDHRPARTQLLARGYVQISDATVMLGRETLTSIQQARLDHVKLKIPFFLSDPKFQELFDPVISRLETDSVNNSLVILIKQFMENDFFLYSLNDEESLHDLFDYFLLSGFVDLGSKRYRQYATNTYYFALPPGADVVVQLWDHAHVDRNMQGIFSESKLSIVPLDEVIDTLGFDPYNPYHRIKYDEQSSDENIPPDINTRISTHRIKGITSNRGLRDNLD